MECDEYGCFILGNEPCPFTELHPMNLKRLKEPAFVAAATSCVMLVILLARSGEHPAITSQPPTDATNPLPGKTVASGEPSPAVNSQPSAEFEETVSLIESQLNKGEFAAAFDMIMVASRLAPSDTRAFDYVMTFIGKGVTAVPQGVMLE